MRRAEQIEERLERITVRLQEIAAEVKELSRKPRDYDDMEWLADVGIPRRESLQLESSALVDERRRLEKEYLRLPKSAKSED